MDNSKIKFIEDFKTRTKLFALRVIKLFQSLPKTDEARIIGKQLLLSSTSVAANYRAVCRARSNADYISKLGIVIEEADESVFWLELLGESNIFPENKLLNLKKEAEEILAILATARRNSKIRE